MQRGGGSREAPEGAGSNGCKSRESEAEGDPCAHDSKNTAGGESARLPSLPPAAGRPASDGKGQSPGGRCNPPREEQRP
eukprot:4672257-Prymnesium_polylepis.1